MKRAVIILLGMLFASGAQAATWTVDHAHSKLGFTVQWSGQPFSAIFQKWDAKIDFDPADLAHAKAEITIDVASAVSGEADLDQNLPGAEAFDAAKFPQAHFVTKSFKSPGAGKYEAAGDLTLHGITKPITLPFTLTMAGNSAHMTGEITVMRTDFGVGTGKEWAGEKPVAHAVKVTVELTATKH